MNKSLLIQIGIGVGGAAVGSLVTWIFTKKHYEKVAEDEIAEARAFYSNMKISEYVKKNENKEINVKETKGEVEISGRPPVVDYTKFYRVVSEEELAENESPPEGVMDEDESKELDRYLDGHKMTADVAADCDIKIISEDSFNNDFPQYSKSTLMYYVGDDTLATEEDEVIDNWDEVVGDLLDIYGFRYDDYEGNDHMYIRNGFLGTDYEVQRIRGSFR